MTCLPALNLPAAYPPTEARSLLACLAGSQPLVDAVQELARRCGIACRFTQPPACKSCEIWGTLPYSCRAGGCCTCAGQLMAGKVDQSDHSYRDDGQIEQVFAFLFVSYLLSDCRIRSNVGEDLL